jgi:hypothetical protein
MDENGQLVIATPEAFQPATETVQLPSQEGTKQAVLLRKPDLVALMSGEGEMPDVLSELVSDEISGRKNGAKTRELQLTPEVVKRLMPLFDAVAIATFAQPRLWREAESDGEHMPVAWLSFEDKAFVFAWALGAEYVPLSKFREETGADVESVPDVPEVRGQTERDTGAKG